MRLYHGSKSGIVGPIRPISRDCCDFGRGFYMGDEPSQPMTLICSAAKPIFYTCEFDLTDLRVHCFEPTIDWAMFVAWNRGLIPERARPYYEAKFRPIIDGSDVIVGKIANDRMVVVLDWFYRSFISDVGLLKALQALNLGDQYVCMTPKACARVTVADARPLSRIECEQYALKASNQRETALKAVDRIRLLHRRDGESFDEIMRRESGVEIYET